MPDAEDDGVLLAEDDLAVEVPDRVASRAGERLDDSVVFGARVVPGRIPPLAAVEPEKRAHRRRRATRFSTVSPIPPSVSDAPGHVSALRITWNTTCSIKRSLANTPVRLDRYISREALHCQRQHETRTMGKCSLST